MAARSIFQRSVAACGRRSPAIRCNSTSTPAASSGAGGSSGAAPGGSGFRWTNKGVRGPAIGQVAGNATNRRSDVNAGAQPVTWASLGVLVVGGTSAVLYYNYKKEEAKTKVAGKVESFGKPQLGGPWELVDHNGIPRTDKDFKGQYVLLYFGFTFCPDICPNELVKMKRVTEAIDKKPNLPKITPLFVTLDPHRDSVAQVAAYVKDFHPRMVGLTGTPQQIARVARAYRVYFSEVDREDDADDYVVDHSIVMYLLSPKGEFLDFYTQMAEAPEIVDRITKTMQSQ